MWAPLLLMLPDATAAGVVDDEYALKAAFLYRFATLVEWPADAFADHDAFSVCVVGDDPFGQRLDDAMHGRTLQGHPIAIRRLAGSPSAGTSCHLLYVTESERGALGAILGSVRARSVLTVSDIRGFVGSGGIIEIERSGARLGFQVDQRAARQAGLKISSQLLRIATAVRGAD